LVIGHSATECAALATVFAWSALEDVRRLLPDTAEIFTRMKHMRTE
jgi:hypothetical protein